jgi:hypothetical protein
MMSVAYKKDAGLLVNTKGSILRVLAYFSMFEYPLTKTEITKYLSPGTAAIDFDAALEQLATDGIVFRINEFYLLQNDNALVKRRKEGNHRAAQLLPKAMKIGKFLSGFPYVRGVGISGSLSKMYADEKADIDFFIITQADRLWIARTLMHLFKKFTFLTGTQHLYCMNYYIDEKALQLNDQNIYTAIETVTLIPAGGTAIPDFFVANAWVNEWFLDCSVHVHHTNEKARNPWLKRTVEWLLNNKTGNRFDNYLMKLTNRRWKKKKQRGVRNEEGKAMSLITGKHFARSNPGMFQERLLARYNEILNGMKTRYPGYFS